jgi:Flp pilus assembly protein TadD
MVLVRRWQSQLRVPKAGRGLAALGVCLALGACASGNGPSPLSLAAELPPAAKDNKQPTIADKSELAKATEWWGNKYAANTRDLEAALNYARNLKAMGEKQRALAVLQQASIFHGDDHKLAGEYGRLALDLDQVNLATQLLAAADDPINPDWRVVSARGTVMAKQGKYAEAIPYYERALSLSHDQPSILSNLALAHAMSGEPAKAELMLRQAAAADPSAPKIRQNLALVLGLQGKYDEAKQIAGADMSADKVADADYLRRVVKLDPQHSPAAAEPQVAQARPTVPVGEDTANVATPETASLQATPAPGTYSGWAPAVAHTHVSKPAATVASVQKPKPAQKAAQGQASKQPVAATALDPTPAQVSTALKPTIDPTDDSWMTQVALTEGPKTKK